MSFYSGLSMETKQQAVSMAKDLAAQGYNSKEIADKLCISESVLRRIKNDVRKSDEKMNG